MNGKTVLLIEVFAYSLKYIRYIREQNILEVTLIIQGGRFSGSLLCPQYGVKLPNKP